MITVTNRFIIMVITIRSPRLFGFFFLLHYMFLLAHLFHASEDNIFIYALLISDKIRENITWFSWYVFINIIVIWEFTHILPFKCTLSTNTRSAPPHIITKLLSFHRTPSATCNYFVPGFKGAFLFSQYVQNTIFLYCLFSFLYIFRFIFDGLPLYIFITFHISFI